MALAAAPATNRLHNLSICPLLLYSLRAARTRVCPGVEEVACCCKQDGYTEHGEIDGNVNLRKSEQDALMLLRRVLRYVGFE